MQHPDYPENFILRGIRVLRRKFYYKFKKDYIKNSVAKRKGRCLRCGGCCLTAPCNHYFADKKICTLWRDKGKCAIPEDCQNFPFDEKDKIPYCKANCGYYWDKKSKQNI